MAGSEIASPVAGLCGLAGWWGIMDVRSEDEQYVAAW
jgi:hypothetical protein